MIWSLDERRVPNKSFRLIRFSIYTMFEYATLSLPRHAGRHYLHGHARHQHLHEVRVSRLVPAVEPARGRLLGHALPRGPGQKAHQAQAETPQHYHHLGHAHLVPGIADGVEVYESYQDQRHQNDHKKRNTFYLGFLSFQRRSSKNLGSQRNPETIVFFWGVSWDRGRGEKHSGRGRGRRGGVRGRGGGVRWRGGYVLGRGGGRFHLPRGIDAHAIFSQLTHCVGGS